MGKWKVLLKVAKIQLTHEDKRMEHYAMIPDGTESKVPLHSAACQSRLELVLHTIRKDTETIHGAKVIFATSPTLKPTRGFWIEKSLTGRALGLVI